MRQARLKAGPQAPAGPHAYYLGRVDEFTHLLHG